jgi:RNA recognition motif. (a.k.a. RRM, RBD, or RNP domain)
MHRNSQQSHLMNSRQVNLNAQGIPVSYAVPGTRSNMGGRAYSFEDTMLPPSALDPQDQGGNPAYSPYGGSQGSSGGGTLFAHPQPWGYGPPDIYGNTPGSPLQPRTTTHLPMYPSQIAGNMRPMAPYGQYFPASSPGPPIQTTASNKGPDGANLFIFHIPNHFTNLDMYQLFCPYGNLLSVRIMVEKDTGRSRGFGFVSYDSPESAALAIKELNGFAVRRNRLFFYIMLLCLVCEVNDCLLTLLIR